MNLFANPKLDNYCIPFFIFMVMACGDKGSHFRPLLTYAIPILIILRFIVSKRYFSFKFKRKNVISLRGLILLYTFWMLIVTLASSNILNSLYYWGKLCIFFSLIYITYIWLNSSVKYWLIIKACCYASFCVATSIYLQYFIVSLGFLNVDSNRLAGMYGNVNTGGFVMSMLSLLCYYTYLVTRRKKYLYLVFYGLISVLITGSRASFLVFVFAIISMYFRRKMPKKIFIFFILAICCMASLIAFHLDELLQLARIDHGTAGRNYLWLIAIQIISGNLLWGIGPGNLKEVGADYLNDLPLISDWERNALLENAIQSSHNMYLEAFVDAGIIGFILYILILFNIVCLYKSGMKCELKHYRQFSYFMLGVVFGIVFRGFFESNGYLCKGWLNVDFMFWIYLILYKRKDIVYVGFDNLSTTGKSSHRRTNL